MSPSPNKDFRITAQCKVNKGYKVRNVFTVYITVSAFAIMFAGRGNIVRLLSFFLRLREVQQLVPSNCKALTSTHASYAFAFATKSERCFCCQGCFAVLSTKECCHIFHSRQKWKQVLQNPFFLSLDWAWLLASFLQKELILVQYCKT